MKLQSIQLNNYRCYQSNDFNFGEDVTLVIGKNGTGKSTLISAIRKGMSFIFSNTGNNKLIKNNSIKVEGFNDWDTTFLELGEGFQWPTKLSYEMLLDDNLLKWSFYKDKFGGKLHSKNYKNAQKKFLDNFSKDDSILPLLAFYGDCYPHKRKESNQVINSFNALLLKSVKLPRDLGYALWNEEGSITTSWFKRTKFILNEIQQEKDKLDSLESEIIDIADRMKNFAVADISATQVKLDILRQRFNLMKSQNYERIVLYETEYKFVSNKVMDFFSNVGELNTDDLILYSITRRRVGKTDNLFFNFGKTTSIDEGIFNEESLPMGYLRLIHIVYDIAYRLFILNGVKETYDGLVLIDEIELHLHPSLQQTILERFTKTFPGLQFIVTTHSPIVLSNLNADTDRKKIIQLEKIDGEYKDDELPNLFTMDYNSNLVDIMGVNISNKLLDAYLNAYNFLKNEDNSLATDYSNKIKDLFDGDIPKFVLEKM